MLHMWRRHGSLCVEYHKYIYCGYSQQMNKTVSWKPLLGVSELKSVCRIRRIWSSPAVRNGKNVPRDLTNVRTVLSSAGRLLSGFSGDGRTQTARTSHRSHFQPSCWNTSHGVASSRTGVPASWTASLHTASLPQHHHFYSSHQSFSQQPTVSYDCFHSLHQSFSQQNWKYHGRSRCYQFPQSQRRWSHSLNTKEKFSLTNEDYNSFLHSLVEEHKTLASAHLQGTSIDHGRFLFLGTVAMAVEEVERNYAELSDLRAMLTESDAELQALAKKDVENTLHMIQDLEERLVDLLVGSEPADKNDIMLEVSAGVGGQEAMLFTGEIFNMYQDYTRYKGWTFDTVDFEKSDIGGLRRASVLITGMDVYKHLKFEGGVHRVQRVPKTEKSGRLHTSTMTVAVLPQPSQIDISVNPKDIEIDTYRASGAGGQHVNKTESAVRITHKPSGTVAECQQDRSQIKNREMAMKILLSRLYQKQVEEQETALRRKRKLQVGSAGRSEKIRTYNYSQDRITDHRGPTTLHNITDFMRGDATMDSLILSLIEQSRLDILQSMIEEFLEQKAAKK